MSIIGSWAEYINTNVIKIKFKTGEQSHGKYTEN